MAVDPVFRRHVLCLGFPHEAGLLPLNFEQLFLQLGLALLPLNRIKRICVIGLGVDHGTEPGCHSFWKHAGKHRQVAGTSLYATTGSVALYSAARTVSFSFGQVISRPCRTKGLTDGLPCAAKA